ncbi:hypothetical protein CCACVL1_08038 [Corchorus capsularis]|uniref:Uncharacterized protein n=1 Tax=Corchorus capsularis TaxID=210143 RepID=A0A1R3J2K1_COCAP|nr:hypothetical protein CCACVL1_08038 [Corchorus capsularis]
MAVIAEMKATTVVTKKGRWETKTSNSGPNQDPKEAQKMNNPQ